MNLGLWNNAAVPEDHDDNTTWVRLPTKGSFNNLGGLYTAPDTSPSPSDAGSEPTPGLSVIGEAVLSAAVQPAASPESGTLPLKDPAAPQHDHCPEPAPIQPRRRRYMRPRYARRLLAVYMVLLALTNAGLVATLAVLVQRPQHLQPPPQLPPPAPRRDRSRVEVFVRGLLGRPPAE